MHKLHDVFFSWTILAPFLSTGLAAPAADWTTKSPRVFTSLPYRFWIETIFLEPLRPLDAEYFRFRKNNPLRFEELNTPFFSDQEPFLVNDDLSFSRVLVAQTCEHKNLFRLNDEHLKNTASSDAQLWPYLLDTDDYPGWYTFAFDVNTTVPRILLDFRAVQVCNSKGDKELQLRARRRDDSSGRTFFSAFPPLFMC